MSTTKPARALFTDFKVFSGTANRALTEEICDALDCPLGSAMIKRFADGETHLQIQENVRGADVFVVQPTSHASRSPPDGTAADDRRFKRASAERITAVLPYYGYARQDRKDRPRMPISAKLVASLIETGGSEPGFGARSARRADSGLFRHSSRSPVFCAGHGRIFERGSAAAS